VSLLVLAATVLFSCLPAAAQQLFNQTNASATSIGSWYSDNWYQLGTGFSGTLNTLTIQCYTSGGPIPSSSNLYLQEFSDSAYTIQTNNYQLNINGNPTCDQYPNYRTFTNLNIPVLPTLYYRLYTYANIQNASAILLGTNATGYAMYDGFEYGVGKVYFYYTFYPYLLSTTPPPPPPPPACPASPNSGASVSTRLVFDSTLVVSALGLWVYGAGGAYINSYSYLTLLSDSSGDPGAVFATSSTVAIDYDSPPTEEFYLFSPPVIIPGNTAFWVQLNSGPPPTSSTGVASTIDFQDVACTPATAANLGSQSTANPTGFAFEPVNTATGNYYTSHADLVVPGKGLAFNFTRSYNSLDTYLGPLGAGWTHSYNVFLTVYSDGTVGVKEADGQQVMFSPTTGGAYTPITPGVFDVLQQNPDGSFTFTQKNQTRFNFSPAGQLVTIVDRNGNAQTLNYGGSGNLTSILDSSGRTFTFTTDTNGRIASLTDPLSRVWQYGYDTNGNLISVLDAAGGTTQYAYNGNHQMSSATDPRGITYLQNTYDSLGRVVTQANARGFVAMLAYNTPATGTTTITDALGNVTQNTYDANLRLVSIIDAKGGVQAYTYDASNDRTSVTDQNGHTTTYGYDANGNNTSIADPLGDIAAFTYDTMNDLLTSTTPKGNTTTLTYDANGNPLTSKDPLGDTTTYTYGTSGLLASKTDARGGTTSFSYDSAGDLIQSTDPLGNSTLFAYDGISRMTSTTDPNGHTTSFAYDNLSRLLAATDPLTHRTQFAYDPIGNLLSVTDANGNATVYAYDDTNNLTNVTDALGHSTTYGYDGNNNRTSFTNASGNTTTYAYNHLNRLVTTVDPLSFSWTYTYDGVGNLTGTTDADKQSNQYGYDPLNRLTSVTYADGSTVAYAYDPDNNRTSMTDPHGVTTYSYDTLDRVLSVTSPGPSTVSYAYNKVGNRASLKYSDGRIVKYGYDKLNRLATVTDWANLETQYAYDKASNLIKTALPNTTSSTYHYDAANRLTSLVNNSGAQAVSAFAYTLDAVGNRLQVVSGSAVTKYSYDALYRLTSWTTPTGAVTQYAYDPFGNRLSMTTSAGTLKYSYDADDRLLAAGKTAFTYDPNGNRISEKAGTVTTAYVYDPLNRLISVTSGPENTQYAYDGDGNRVSQQAGTEVYQYLNDTVAALPVVLNEQGPDGDIDYLYGASMISATAATFQDFYQYDGLGSVVNVTNSTGSTEEKYSYNPWGVPATPSDPLGTKNKYKFTGQALDPATGLYFLRARYYDPVYSRFLTRDSAPASVLAPLSLNRYQYALSNPITYIDASGMTTTDTTQSSPWNRTGPNFVLPNTVNNPQFTSPSGGGYSPPCNGASNCSDWVSSGLQTLLPGNAATNILSAGVAVNRDSNNAPALVLDFLDLGLAICSGVTVCDVLSGGLFVFQTVSTIDAQLPPNGSTPSVAQPIGPIQIK
jgi:RHS repeat-associated protein